MNLFTNRDFFFFSGKNGNSRIVFPSVHHERDCMQSIYGVFLRSVFLSASLRAINLLLFRCQAGPCHHGMVRPKVVDGGSASDMEATANILNKRTANEGWSSSFGFRRGANNSSP
jgi:hypothetical protein